MRSRSSERPATATCFVCKLKFPLEDTHLDDDGMRCCEECDEADAGEDLADQIENIADTMHDGEEE